MRGACSTCWPSDLLGPPTSPVVPNASFMPTPEQCDAASSSWGRAAPHWLTDKIARCARRQERWHGLWQLTSAPDHARGCPDPFGASHPRFGRANRPCSVLFLTQARERVNPCAGRVRVVRPILAHGTMQPPTPHKTTRLSRCHGPTRGPVRRRVPAGVSKVQPAPPSERGVRAAMERVANAPGEAAAQLLGQRARARAQPLRRLPRKRHVDVRGAGRLEPAGMGSIRHWRIRHWTPSPPYG
jgi:hypothetical protein